MDYLAFYQGAESVLNKHANLWDDTKAKVTSMYRENVAAPFATGVSDKNYGGLANYNTSTGKMDPNESSVVDTVFGQQKPQDHSKNFGFLGRQIYNSGRSGTGKRVADMFTGGDHAVGAQIAEKSKGVLSLDGPGDIQVHQSKILPAMLSKARTWMASNPGKAWGLGLGAVGLGMGALGGLGAFNGAGDKRPQLSQNVPAGMAGKPVYAGRQGNVFTPALSA